MAALSLYITAIELNGTTRPPKSLKFPKPLKNRALYNHRRPEERNDKDFVLGSLRPDLDEFNGCFDMVIGNPPWSRLKGNDKESKAKIEVHNAVFTDLTRQVLTERGLGDIAKKYSNPDNNPDLPFLWKSTQWVKPGGIIAMALPGRIFLKQSKAGTHAFNAILQGLEVTGILNGSNLSDTKVWPKMGQAFILFFARNSVPKANHHFQFVTPHFERHLNDKGRIRIDYQSAQPIAACKAIEDSRLLKTLAVGSTLDAEVLRKLDELEWPDVKSYWNTQGLYSGLGYNCSPKQQQYDASFMYNLPDFTQPGFKEFSVNTSSLPKFKFPTAHMPRCVDLYSPPLLIVPESPGSSSFTPKSWIVREQTVFKKSFYGFSAHKSKGTGVEIALLHLITHSDLFKYHVLMTSSRMGVERRTFLKQNIDNFPFPNIDALSERERKCAIELSSGLENAFDTPWKKINSYVFELYGLDEYDHQVVKDTLEIAQPFKESRDRANAHPAKAERNKFYLELQRLLAPSFDITHETVTINEVEIEKLDILSPWHFFSVSSSPNSKIQDPETQKQLVSQIIKEANRTGCSRVTVHDEGCLLVGIIGQYRYWTLSRARICAMDIQRYHLDAFPFGKS